MSKDHKEESSHRCPCGSGRDASSCCAPFVAILALSDAPVETVLLEWQQHYSVPIKQSFMRRARPFAFRVSLYLDSVCQRFMDLGFPESTKGSERLDQQVRSIKHNILLSLIASFSCLEQGLYLQAGALIRCCIEDAMALLDITQDRRQLGQFVSGSYSVTRVTSRVKDLVPDDILRWYGQYSANFAHFGPFHAAGYVPRACFVDNYVIGSGLENILLATYAYHVILARIYALQVTCDDIWSRCADGSLGYTHDNTARRYVRTLQQAILAEFPPDQRHEGFTYSTPVAAK